MVSSAATKVCTSRSSSAPSTLLSAPVIIDMPMLRTFTPARPPTFAGAISSRMNRPSRNEPSRLRRVQEVQRRAGRRGVDDDQVPRVLGPQLAELLHRHVLLRAREAGRQRLVEGVLQDRLARSGSACCDDDLVERPLHVEHHRVQRAAGRPIDPGHRARGVVQLGQAHRLGEPAGRVDGQHDDRAARARPPAAPSAAAVVVLPTPPEPQQTTIRVPGSSSSASTSSRGLQAHRFRPRARLRRSRHRPRRPRTGRPRRRPAPRGEPPSACAGSRPAGTARRGPRRRRGAAVRTGRPSAASSARCSRSSTTRSACSCAWASSGVDEAVGRSAAAGAAQPAWDSALATAVRRLPMPPPWSAADSSASRSSTGRTMLTTTAPTGSPAARSSATPSTVSWTGISSSSVTRWTAVCGDFSTPHDGLRLVVDRADPGQPGHLGVDVEEAGDPAGRRRVQHDGVVDRPPALSLRRTASYTLPVSSTSRRPGATVVAKSIAPSFFSARPARPSL